MNKNIFLLAGLAIAIAFTGCTKDFEDLNTNPNEPASVSPEPPDRFPEADHGRDERLLLGQPPRHATRPVLVLQPSESRSSVPYKPAGAAGPLQSVTPMTSPVSEATATRLRWRSCCRPGPTRLTDATQALQGVANTTPSYIHDAMTSMDDGPGPQGDQVYGGDMMMWEKFANTLKLRVAMRMSDVAPDQAQSVGEAALEGGMKRPMRRTPSSPTSTLRRTTTPSTRTTRRATTSQLPTPWWIG